MKGRYARSVLATYAAVFSLAVSPTVAELLSEVREWMDESVKPCDDFYMHVCGNFIKNSPLGDEKAMEHAMMPAHRNLKASVDAILADTSNQAGKLYASCMDTSRIEEAGMAPMRSTFNRLSAISNHEQLLAFAGQLSVDNTISFVGYRIRPDPKNATWSALMLSMPNLPLHATVYQIPGVDVDELSKQLSIYVAATLSGTGEWEEQQAVSTADRVVELVNKFVPLYTAIGSALRPHSVDTLYPAITVAEAKEKFPLLAGAFFSNVNELADDGPVPVLSPKYFAEAEKIIQETDIEVLKAYIAFGVVNSNIESMPEALRNAKRVLVSTLTDSHEPENRSATCTRLVTTTLPDIIGNLVLKAWQAEEGVKMTRTIVDNVQHAMEKRVLEVEWLSNETRQDAVKKVRAMATVVGAPDIAEGFKFDDNTTFSTNAVKAVRLTNLKLLRLVGKPVDRLAWRNAAATMNAYHEFALNQVAVAVGLLQAPMFNSSFHPVRNYAAIGTIAGHEIVHGYDTLGRFYDENGSVRRWWTDADEAEFKRRSECFIKQYSSFNLTDDQGNYVTNNDGIATLGENIADNGGLKLARQGYKVFAQENPDILRGFDLTDDEIEKLFFISLGQTHCSSINAAGIEFLVYNEPHSIGPARVNGMMMNSRDFSEVFQCPIGSAMNPVTKCEIW